MAVITGTALKLMAKELLKKDIIKIIDSKPNDDEDLRNIRDKALILIGFYNYISHLIIYYH